jgi:hypothetical protein
LVVYEAGHRHGRGDDPANIAAQRIALNVLLQSTLERSIRVTANNAPAFAPATQPTEFAIDDIEGGIEPYTIQWTSTCGGVFDAPNARVTSWTPPGNIVGDRCLISGRVADACGNGRAG